MKKRNRIQGYNILLLACCLTACQVRRPEKVLQDAKMEDVLYDYHIAKAMGEEARYDEHYKQALYIESVFRKHGITQSDFDTSMVWFSRHPELLSKIYEKVNTRLKAERDGIDHLIALRDNKPKESLPGDSINVWAWQPVYRLTGMPLNNKMVFVLPADSNFRDRDTLRWNVRFRFHGSSALNDDVPTDSAYAPLMAMQILYEKNDTVVDAIRKVRGAGVETISLYADTLGKIKEVRGFIYYPEQRTLRSVLADRISLMRYHAKDSLMTSPKDSLLQTPDSVRKDTVKRRPLEPRPLENHKVNGNKIPEHRSRRPRPTPPGRG